MRTTDFFECLPDSGDPSARTQVLNDQMVEALRRGPIEQAGDLDAAVGMLDLVQDDIEAFGTGGGEQLRNQQMVLALRALKAVCRRLGITLALPFRDFTTFRSYWIREGASGGGSWKARRDLIEDLLGPARLRLRKLEDICKRSRGMSTLTLTPRSFIVPATSDQTKLLTEHVRPG